MGNSVDCPNDIDEIAYEERLENAELEVLKLMDIPLEHIDRRKIWVEHGETEGERVCIRTLLINDKDRQTAEKSWLDTLLGKHQNS